MDKMTEVTFIAIGPEEKVVALREKLRELAISSLSKGIETLLTTKRVAEDETPST